MAAPMLVSDDMLELIPVALVVLPVRSEAATLTSPVATTVTSSAIRATLDVTIQLTAIAAAMPVPPPPSPDWLLDFSFADLVCSLDLGMSPASLVLPSLLGLSFSCLLDFSSPDLSPLSLPLAL